MTDTPACGSGRPLPGPHSLWAHSLSRHATICRAIAAPWKIGGALSRLGQRNRETLAGCCALTNRKCECVASPRYCVGDEYIGPGILDQAPGPSHFLSACWNSRRCGTREGPAAVKAANASPLDRRRADAAYAGSRPTISPRHPKPPPLL